MAHAKLAKLIALAVPLARDDRVGVCRRVERLFRVRYGTGCIEEEQEGC